jgi:DNA-binding NtrC family response regulator
VINDHHDTLDRIRLNLNRIGVATITAVSDVEALRHLRYRTEIIDVVLLYLGRPNQDENNICDEVKLLDGDIPIIVVGNEEDSNFAHRYSNVPSVTKLAKPYLFKDMVQVLRRVINEKKLCSK